MEQIGISQQVEEWVEQLSSPDDRVACGAMKQLKRESARSAEAYAYFDLFSAMLRSRKSYQRNRALTLLAANARWDGEDRLGKVLTDYLKCLSDERPVTVRQCVQGLGEIGAACPQHRERIREALEKANFSRYGDSMAPLLIRDTAAALKQMEQARLS